MLLFKMVNLLYSPVLAVPALKAVDRLVAEKPAEPVRLQYFQPSSK